jgi:transcriptional regulator with XRE-family HTH domain
MKEDFLAAFREARKARAEFYKPHEIVVELRKIREQSRISQDAVGAALGKTQAHISNYERGHPRYQSPRICTLDEWADTLGYEIVLRAKESK